MLASARPSAPNSKKSKRAKHRLTRTYSTENLRLRKLIAMNPSPGISTKSVGQDRKSTRLNSSHQIISYAVFCLKKKKDYDTVIKIDACTPMPRDTASPLHLASVRL